MKVGYTYILTENDCWIVDQAIRQEPIDHAAIDYAELAEDHRCEWIENGDTERYRAIGRSMKELARAIAKAEGII